MTNNFQLVIAFTVLLSLLGCAAGEGSRPRSAQATDIDVSAYSSFGWQDRGGHAPVTILDNQIRTAIRAGLTAKGYVESLDDPDFLVSHETVEQETVKQGSPVRIGIGVGSWGGNVGGSVGTSVDVGERDRVQDQIRVTVRAVDAGEQREAWVGSTGALSVPMEGDAVDRAVTGLMKQFPDKRR